MATTDLLQGFQMIAALSQATINFQFSQLHKQRVIHDTLDIGLADTGIALKARLAAPTVSMSVTGRRRAVLFTLNMSSGTFSFYEGIGPNARQKSVEFTDWAYAFTVDMDMQQLAQDAVKAGQAIPPVVKQHLAQFSDDLFTVRQLFLDFESADLATYDRAHSRMVFPGGAAVTPGQMTQFQLAIGNYFASLKGTGNPYILGYSVEQNGGAHATASTFTPTAATFSTFDDPKSEDLNALNFLLMTGGQPLPTDANAGLFDRNWLTPTAFDGKFVVSRALFIDRWLVPVIADALQAGVSQAADDSWLFAGNEEQKFTTPKGANCMSNLTPIDTHNTITQIRNAGAVVDRSQTDRVRINMSGTFTYVYRIDMICVFPEWMAETALIKWSATLDVAAGANGQIAATVTPTIQPAAKSTDGDFLGKGDIALIPNNQHVLDNIGSEFVRQIQVALEGFQDAFRSAQSRLVLPAGDVFFFKNAQVDLNGNLTLDISYKASRPA